MEPEQEQPNGIELFDPIAEAMFFVGLKLTPTTEKEKSTATPILNNGKKTVLG